jgi:hypothetical protein
MEASPMPARVMWKRSPGVAGSSGASEPDRMISPARKGMPKRLSVLASQATAVAG